MTAHDQDETLADLRVEIEPETPAANKASDIL